MMRLQVQVEGPSDREVVSGILKRFSYNLSVRSGRGHMKGKGAIVKYLGVILEDSKTDKLLLFMDEDARPGLRRETREISPVTKPVYVICVPGLETWVRGLLEPDDVPEYDRRLRTEGKTDAARWAVSRFRRERLQADPVVQKILDFCRCQDLPGHRFPEDFA